MLNNLNNLYSLYTSSLEPSNKTLALSITIAISIYSYTESISDVTNIKARYKEENITT